jgi:hypothetical protein
LRTVLHTRTITEHAAPAALYSQAEAFRFPELTATSLAGDEVPIGVGCGLFANRWTLLGCAGSSFAQEMVDKWLVGAVAEEAAAAEGGAAAAPAGLQARWLALVEGTVLVWFQRPLLASMRRSVPAERHGRFLCRFESDASELRRKLQMSNRYLGYVCLVDPQGVVRWHVHGNEPPTEEQLAALKSLVGGAVGQTK